MKLIIAGGGTGGHLYPGIAVAEKAKENGIETLFLVSDRGIEREVLSKLGYTFKEQNITGFMGVSVKAKAASLAKLAAALFEVSKLINKNDNILLLGGFAAAPAAICGVLKGCGVYIHEANSVMGNVNRMLARCAKEVFISYKDTKGAPLMAKLVGNPVRNAFQRKEVKESLTKHILVLGGSGGARAVNRAAAGAVDALLSKGYSVTHQTGKALFEEACEAYKKALPAFPEVKGLKVEPYIDDTAAEYERADIVVARSGSGTVFECLYSKRPALYIPFAKAVNNHQYYNAKSVTEEGYAAFLTEEELSPETLVKAVTDISENYAAYMEKLKAVEMPDTAGKILEFMGLI